MPCKTRKEGQEASKVAKPSTFEEPFKPFRSHFIPVDFIIPIDKEEDKPSISSCNRVPWVRFPQDSKDENDAFVLSWDNQLVGDDYVEYISDDDWANKDQDVEGYFFDGDFQKLTISIYDLNVKCALSKWLAN